MAGISHPLSVNTDVQYLSPRCKCSGRKFAISTGKIKSSHKLSDGKFYYVIKGERKNIPQDGIIKVLNK